ncbi:hypothetical protein LIER_37271 [Lithospermum erythrorhizon]|uniref:Uncharacterized protein n=1 Tax=Lithospermum erythrorhizon TaxID=34254 RepID=A0AAV3PJ81_LITER
MSGAKGENVIKAKEAVEDNPEVQENEKFEAAETKYDSNVTSENSSTPSIEEQEKAIKKKYGGLLPKKALISKDHEHAFFDSADWVLGKQKKNKGPIEEELRPKLEPTHNQAPSRRPSYAAIEMSEDNDNSQTTEDESKGSGLTDPKRELLEDHITKT